MISAHFVCIFWANGRAWVIPLRKEKHQQFSFTRILNVTRYRCKVIVDIAEFESAVVKFLSKTTIIAFFSAILATNWSHRNTQDVVECPFS